MKIVNVTASVDGLLVYYSEGETEFAAEKLAWEKISRYLDRLGSSVWPVSIKVEIDGKSIVDSEAVYNFDNGKWEM